MQQASRPLPFAAIDAQDAALGAELPPSPSSHTHTAAGAAANAGIYAPNAAFGDLKQGEGGEELLGLAGDLRAELRRCVHKAREVCNREFDRKLLDLHRRVQRYKFGKPALGNTPTPQHQALRSKSLHKYPLILSLPVIPLCVCLVCA